MTHPKNNGAEKRWYMKFYQKSCRALSMFLRLLRFELGDMWQRGLFERAIGNLFWVAAAAMGVYGEMQIDPNTRSMVRIGIVPMVLLGGVFKIAGDKKHEYHSVKKGQMKFMKKFGEAGPSLSALEFDFVRKINEKFYLGRMTYREFLRLAKAYSNLHMMRKTEELPETKDAYKMSIDDSKNFQNIYKRMLLWYCRQSPGMWEGFEKDMQENDLTVTEEDHRSVGETISNVHPAFVSEPVAHFKSAKALAMLASACEMERRRKRLEEKLVDGEDLLDEC